MTYTIGEASNKLHELMEAIKNGEQVALYGKTASLPLIWFHSKASKLRHWK
jgi:hypothetical protein